MNLHRNLTKVQQQLYKAMDDSLNRMWKVQGGQREFVGQWDTFVQRARADLPQLLREVTRRVRNGGELAEQLLSGLSDKIRQHQDAYEARVSQVEEVAPGCVPYTRVRTGD